MSSTVYKITIKTQNGIITAKYKSPNKLEVSEDLFLYYGGKTNVVKITAVRKNIVEAEEVAEL